jgi:hypothetical protein
MRAILIILAREILICGINLVAHDDTEDIIAE